jgi:hypothetical protein
MLIMYRISTSLSVRATSKSYLKAIAEMQSETRNDLKIYQNKSTHYRNLLELLEESSANLYTDAPFLRNSGTVFLRYNAIGHTLR